MREPSFGGEKLRRKIRAWGRLQTRDGEEASLGLLGHLYGQVGTQEGLPWGSVGKNPPANAGHLALISGSGRSSEGGHGNPLQYSFLQNLTDRITWWATVHRVIKSQT